MSPATAITVFAGRYVVRQKSRMVLSGSARMPLSSPQISRPSGPSPNNAVWNRICAYSAGSSWYERISSMITERSPSISLASRTGRTISSPRTSTARGASRRGTRTQYTVDSRSVEALNEPPTPSIASLIERVDGYARVPLNVMCSMKWATPASLADSRREPARTYAAMETERAPGNRELITRGPEGSAVRSNIAADGTGMGPRRRSGLVGVSEPPWRHFGATSVPTEGGTAGARRTAHGAALAPPAFQRTAERPAHGGNPSF